MMMASTIIASQLALNIIFIFFALTQLSTAAGGVQNDEKRNAICLTLADPDDGNASSTEAAPFVTVPENSSSVLRQPPPNRRRWRRGNNNSPKMSAKGEVRFPSLGSSINGSFGRRNALKTESGRRLVTDLTKIEREGDASASASTTGPIDSTMKKVQEHQLHLALEVMLAQSSDQMAKQREVLKLALYYEQILQLFKDALRRDKVELEKAKSDLKKWEESGNAGIDKLDLANMQKYVAELQKNVQHMKEINQRIKIGIDGLLKIAQNKEPFSFGQYIYDMKERNGPPVLRDMLANWERMVPYMWDRAQMRKWVINHSKNEEQKALHLLYKLAKRHPENEKLIRNINHLLLVDAAFDRAAREKCLKVAFAVPLRNWAAIAQSMKPEMVDDYFIRPLSFNFHGLTVEYNSKMESEFSDEMDFRELKEEAKTSFIKNMWHTFCKIFNPYSKRDWETHRRELEAQKEKCLWGMLAAMSQEARDRAKECVKGSVFILMLLKQMYSDETQQKLANAKSKVDQLKHDIEKIKRAQKEAKANISSSQRRRIRRHNPKNEEEKEGKKNEEEGGIGGGEKGNANNGIDIDYESYGDYEDEGDRDDDYDEDDDDDYGDDESDQDEDDQQQYHNRQKLASSAWSSSTNLIAPLWMPTRHSYGSSKENAAETTESPKASKSIIEQSSSPSSSPKNYLQKFKHIWGPASSPKKLAWSSSFSSVSSDKDGIEAAANGDEDEAIILAAQQVAEELKRRKAVEAKIKKWKEPKRQRKTKLPSSTRGTTTLNLLDAIEEDSLGELGSNADHLSQQGDAGGDDRQLSIVGDHTLKGLQAQLVQAQTYHDKLDDAFKQTLMVREQYHRLRMCKMSTIHPDRPIMNFYGLYNEIMSSVNSKEHANFFHAMHNKVVQEVQQEIGTKIGENDYHIVNLLDDYLEKQTRWLFAVGPGQDFLRNLLELSGQMTGAEVRACAEKFRWFAGCDVSEQPTQVIEANGSGTVPHREAAIDAATLVERDNNEEYEEFFLREPSLMMALNEEGKGEADNKKKRMSTTSTSDGSGEGSGSDGGNGGGPSSNSGKLKKVAAASANSDKGKARKEKKSRHLPSTSGGGGADLDSSSESANSSGNEFPTKKMRDELRKQALRNSLRPLNISASLPNERAKPKTPKK